VRYFKNSMTQYHKLVRDKIPEILDAKGIPHEKTLVTGAEYRKVLIEKLVEEVAEFAEAGAVEELADVLEVVSALRTLPEYENVEEVRKKKEEERGGFTGGIVLKGEK